MPINQKMSPGAMSLCLLLSSGLFLDTSAASLRYEKDAEIAINQPKERLPVWSWGSMVRVELNNTAAPIISALDESGYVITTVEFKLPGAYRITLSSFTRGRDGVFVVCGWSADDAGRLAAFVASANGQQPPQVIRTNPYFPNALAIAGDGSIWTTNIQMTAEQREVKTDYNVLRHYDRTGALLGSAISRSSLSSSQVSCCIGQMAASLTRVGWYTGPGEGEGSEYIEIQPDGAILRFPGVKLSQNETFMGLALTDSLTVVSVQDSKAHDNRLVIADPATLSWQPVTIENFSGRLGYLYGGDGDRVIVRHRELNNTVRVFRVIQ